MLRTWESNFLNVFVQFQNGDLKLLSDCTQYIPGPNCSKLTTSLVNETLNFRKLISQICQYFLLKTQNFSIFGYKVVKHLTS